MAKIKNGILSGIIGALSFSNYKGRQIVKSRPGKGKKKRKSTLAQKGQMNKLIVVNQFLKNIKPLITVGYQDSDKLSAYNECVSELLKNAVVPEGKNYVIEYGQVRISRGLINTPDIESIVSDSDTLTLNWNPSVKPINAHKNDEATVLLYALDGTTEIIDCIGLRAEGKGIVEIPAYITKPFHAWVFFSNPRLYPYESRKKVSDSVYLGLFQLN